ncbi:nucleotidyltransferase family protein [Microlunatus soli]|uniref:hypothetical protein n=1 Tax=Microlunatus soli TaxID=630515 RepID=UPI0012F7BA4A|nr:hypothetical protein [Microlunatus soli]
MSDPESVRQAYDRIRPLVDDVARHVSDTLERYCKDNGYLFRERTKELTSLVEKLDGGRVEQWSAIDDLYACTVVVPVRDHEEKVLRKLDSSFARESVRSRSDAKKAPDVFRFDGTRWYGTMSAAAASGRQPGAGDVIFEVQVVTAFEYAWIAVTHDLVYKGDTADWRKQRLAAQLKATVEQAEVLISAFESVSDAVLPSPWPETEVKTQIVERFKRLADDGSLPDMILPASWRRFGDNVYALVKSYEKNAYKVPGAVDSLLDTIEADLLGAEPRHLPTSGTLFQYVLSVVHRAETDGSLANFRIVPSRELSDLYDIQQLEKTFVFDADMDPSVRSDPPPDTILEDPR